MTTLNPTLTSLISAWKDAKDVLDQAKQAEADLRREIVENSGLFNSEKTDGTETYQLANDYKLKCVKKTSYIMANKNGETFQALRDLSELSEGSARIAESLVNFDAKLRVSEYKKLTDPEKRIMDDVITTKPAMPSLTLVEPK